MALTSHFASALQTWCKNHEHVSLRTIALEAETSNLSQYRAGTRSVTLEVITKILPVIERHSTRAAAVTLLIAYLTDETPETHQDAIRIEPVDAAGEPTADVYHALADRWERKARLEPDFMAMWQGMDAYMHTPEDLLYARPESDIALVAEPMVEYKVTPKTGGGSSSIFHDTIRHDVSPMSAAADHEP